MTVVSTSLEPPERPDEPVPMPNVCQQFDVRYAHAVDMLSDLEVSFEWTPP